VRVDGSAGVGGRVRVDDSAGVGGSSGHGGAGIGGASGDTSRVCTPPISEGARCDTYPQCGCPERENCVFFRRSETDAPELSCVADGWLQPFEACKTSRDCTHGYGCVNRACRRFCENVDDSSCPDVGAECRQTWTDNAPSSGNYTCSRTCDLATPGLDDGDFDPCGDGMGCDVYTSKRDGASRTDCFTPKDMREQLELCSSDKCAPGFVCARHPDYTNDTGYCRRWCHVGRNDCPTGQACESDGTTIINHVEFGSCRAVCDPVTPGRDTNGWAACRQGTRCYPLVSGRSVCAPIVASAGVQASPCADEDGSPDGSKCAPGFTCAYPPKGSPMCTRYCFVNEIPATCSVGVCTSSSPKKFAGTKEVGVCRSAENP
jgi:hypothetical protein